MTDKEFLEEFIGRFKMCSTRWKEGVDPKGLIDEAREAGAIESIRVNYPRNIPIQGWSDYYTGSLYYYFNEDGKLVGISTERNETFRKR